MASAAAAAPAAAAADEAEKPEVISGQVAKAMDPGAHMAKYVGKTTNARGIPTIVFIEDVEKFMAEKETTVELTIGAFTEMLQKYKLMEASLTRQKFSLKTKIPEIDSTLEMVLMLKQKKDDEEELLANYPLSEVVLARARVNTSAGTVCLWLGANVMVEYTHDEAIAMLQKNAKSAELKLAETNEDLGHLKDQITTLEVNMARVFNYNVKVTRAAKEGAEAAGSEGGAGAVAKK